MCLNALNRDGEATTLWARKRQQKPRTSLGRRGVWRMPVKMIGPVRSVAAALYKSTKDVGYGDASRPRR